MKPLRQQGYELLHNGLIELSRVERNGIRIDTKRLAATKEKLATKIRSLKDELIKDDVWKAWRKRFGEKSNIGSRAQQATILFDVMGFKVTERTETGRPSMDEESLQKIDHPFVQQFLRLTKYEKALGTFLKGIEREIVDGRLHPSFSLHMAKSYRSSSDSPNFQNFPVRDKEVAEIIRSLFIASPNSVLTENDFKGIEVALSAAYHKDPVFIGYITTPGKDMHRDMAAQIYCLEPGQVSKEARYGAKNKFVFPQFYGDFYISCARALWDWIQKGKLTGPDGQSLYKHLKKQGIRELGDLDVEQEARSGTFERHIRDVEKDFWNNRFRKYGQWKRDWYDTYLKKGHFDILTGFRVEGFFSRNQVTNLPVQGAAFHCLLWTLIQVNRLLRKYKMKSLVVGQIHDSLIGDIPARELRDYLEIVEDVATKQLPKHWRWLVVSPEIEYEVCPLGGSWFQKREVKFKQGKFQHPKNPKLFTDNPLKFLNVLT